MIDVITTVSFYNIFTLHYLQFLIAFIYAMIWGHYLQFLITFIYAMIWGLGKRSPYSD
jgi:hypothetical protein